MRHLGIVGGIICLVGSVFLLGSWTSLPAQEKKLPIPDKNAQAEALKLVQDIFAAEIKKAQGPKNPDPKEAQEAREAGVKLAKEFLQQARDCLGKKLVADSYVLLNQSRDLAARAGDASLTLLAVEELARDFNVEPLVLKAEALAQVEKAIASKEEGKDLVDLTLPLISEALEADQYDVAIDLGKVAELAAKKSQNIPLVASVKKRNDEIVTIKKGFARLQEFVDRLKKNPDDAEANLELGKYHALLKGRWERGLPLLAKGNDASLKKLAGEDLDRPKEIKDQLALADSWWELAQGEKDPSQLNLQRRAMYWYEKVLPFLAGLNRTKAFKRIDQVAARVAGLPVEGPVVKAGELKKFEGHTDSIKSVAISLDGRYGVSGSKDQTVRVWDLVAGKEVKVLRGHTKEIWSVAFHPNSRQVYSVSWDATARAWDILKGQQTQVYNHPLDLNGLALNRDGSQLLTASDDKTVYLRSTATGNEIRRFQGHNAFVYCTAFSPDNRLVASGGNDRTVRVFDLATGNLVKAFEGHIDAVTQVVFSPDSRFLFSCGDGSPRMWDIAMGKEVRRFEGHNGLVQGLALSPDGRRLLTGGDDKTLRLWDVASGKELAKLQGHTDAVLCVAFSADGRRALSGSTDRTVRLWGLPRF